ncbi:hypothetical protein MMC29_000278 [Sticta canariensis]|nr:hypothetical protein [Sticta canariensis]
MEPTPFCLTFGVELEFIVRYNPEFYKDASMLAEEKGWSWEHDLSTNPHDAYGSLVRQNMVQLLNDNGIPANSYKDFKMWSVCTDSSVAPIDTSGSWYPIELISPVLVYSPTSLEEVERAVELLVSKFSLYANESCGLHVHVGNAKTGFSMRTLKNFCSLITVFEDQLASLHTIDRVHSTFAKSFTKAFYPGLTTREKLSAIDQLGIVGDLFDNFSHTHDAFYDKHMAVNFSNLYGGDPLRTIEFRQHRGTLDPKLITNWVKVACNLIDKSYTDKASFHDLIEKHTSIGDTKYTVIDLFKDLELSDLAEFYEPITILLHGTDQSPAVEDEFRDGVLTVSTPGRYYTPWEKKFGPWPPSEQKPYKWSGKSYLRESNSPPSESLRQEQPWENRVVPNTAEYRDDGQPNYRNPPERETDEVFW